MEMGNDKCLDLIDEYRKRPVLWDPKHKHYYLRNKKMEAWEEISSTLGIEIQAAKHKMCSLLGSFRREKTKVKRIIGAGDDCREVPASRWFAFERLQFLMDREDVRKRNKPRRTSGTMDYNLDMDEDEDSMITVEVKPDITDDTQDDLATIAADYYYRNAEDSHSHRLQVHKVSTPVSPEKAEEIMEDPGDNTFSPIKVTPETEFDLWSRSLAVQLNNMDTLRALRLQFQLQKILSDERIQFEIEKAEAAMQSSTQEYSDEFIQGQDFMCSTLEEQQRFATQQAG
ncbi:transcription factor Adf-1 isoform X2 [Nilaparvata lugens]|uniref:transcription factor Adf-1 isoform X2 n=1 Tax=Nilaparvata lugens TaxID=108931 RepID=UPI00193E779B|nr:transcription factor Adf-1 isoform X2 [Nilaparvata lugens]